MKYPPGHRRLLLFSSSFPFGRGEPFLAAELPFLEEAFDEIVIFSNDVSSPQTWPVGPRVRCVRIPYEISRFEKLAALRGLVNPAVRQELRSSRRRAPALPFKRVVAAVLSSWAKAQKFGRLAARVVAESPGATVCAYSYWANDMAVTAAFARAHGVVHRAITRAHGWDVYSSRPEVGILPFRDHLAHNLDAVLFVSEDGRNFFDASVKGGRALRDVVRLGTAMRAEYPQGRGNPFTIVSCSALIPVKRIELLARAIVSAGMPVQWTHVGDGPGRMEIERICSSLPPGVSMELTGHLSAEDVIRTWRRLRPSALVNVSSSEGIPVSMMEAMSLGIPVIGSRVGGVPEIVTHGINGYLLSADPTPAEIVDAIKLISEVPPETFQKLAAGAWRTWNENFRADANFRKLIGILDPAREREHPPDGKSIDGL